jgi:hypothetical protein
MAEVSDLVSKLVDSIKTYSPMKSPSLRGASLLRESSSMAQKFRLVMLKKIISTFLQNKVAP